MKYIFLLFLIHVALGSSLRLSLDNSIMLSGGQEVNIPLKCVGSHGEVRYEIKGLPQGLNLNSNSITGRTSSQFGSYPVLIDAVDQEGNSASQIIVIRISSNSAGGSNGSTTISNSTSTSSSSSTTIVTENQSSTATTNTTAPSTNTNQNNINNLLDILAPSGSTTSFTANPSPSLQSQSYPTVAAPTGVPQGTPSNVVPNLIKEAQAPRNESSKNKITADSVRTSAIFQRQLNANKAIANLLDIIDQLRANTNAAKSDIPALEAELKSAIQQQRRTQNQIINAENQKQRLNLAISNLNDQINRLRNQLADLQSSLTTDSQTITTHEQEVKTLTTTIEDFNKQIAATNDSINREKKMLDDINKSITDTSNRIASLKEEVSRRRKELDDSEGSLTRARANSVKIDGEIDDLLSKLEDARDRKDKSLREEQRLKNLKVTLVPLIVDAENQIISNEKTLNDLQNRRNSIIPTIQGLMETLKNQEKNRSAVTEQVTKTTTKITSKSQVTRDLNALIQGKQKEINDGLGNLKFLRSQVTSYEENLRKAYNQGNDANTRVSHSRENLEAMVLRWRTDYSQLEEANLNLEKARAEKELADLAMEELLQERSSALPYSIVPNGNGVSNKGTPTGNNPRGSPLGPLSANNNGNHPNPFSSEAQQIQSYTHYLSSAYASGIDPTRPETVTKNYPFTIYHAAKSQLKKEGAVIPITVSSGVKVGERFAFTDDFACNSAGVSQNIQGVIREIGENIIRVEDQSGSKEYIVRIGTCSQASANTNNYSLGIGDLIIFSGQQVGPQTYNLFSAQCRCSHC